MTTEFVNYYELLSIPSTADADAIKKAIQAARRVWAKNAAQSGKPERKAQAEQRLAWINDAERVLLNASTRAQFDRDLAAYRPPAAATSGDSENRDWLALAREYVAQGNYHAANYAAREAINLSGSNHEAWYIRANSSLMMGRGSDAEYEYNEAIRLQPDNSVYHFDLAEAFAEQGKWQSALREYETALSLEPSNGVYKTAIANVYLNNDQPKKALEIMEAVVKADPDQQIFQYYLAIALVDTAVSNWSVLHDGTRWITTEAQLNYTKTAVTRAQGLKFQDDELRSYIRELQGEITESESVKFIAPDGAQYWYAAIVVGMLCYIIPGVLILWYFITRYRKPLWQHRAKSGLVRQVGLQ